jgi:hypothetical protein
MVYTYQKGVLKSFVQKNMNWIILALAGIFIFTQFSYLIQVSKADSTTTKVYGDTYSGGSIPGWLFNRDASTSTPFEFNNDESTLGDGSLYVLPIGANPSDKFIGEYFVLDEVANTSSISYDFKIGGGGDASDANEFYLNVYTLIDDTYSNYYDCRFDYVPSTGSTSSFTTFSVDLSSPADVVKKSGWSSYDDPCPTNPKDMPAGSHLFFFAISLGDTSANDEGVDGYFDNVVFESNEDTEIFDFEMAPEQIAICHRTNSESNPYESISVDHSAIDGEGANDHTSHEGPVFEEGLKDEKIKWGDIIPPVHNVTEGQNWTEEGQLIWSNGCSAGQVVDDEVACSVTRYSDVTNTVNEKSDANAVALSWIHPAWKADIDGATWIWGDDPVADAQNETVQTFKNQFYWHGPIDTAVIDVASDNTQKVYVNGVMVGSETINGNTFKAAVQYDIASAVLQGLNTIEIEVTNWEWNTTNPQVNPAGLLYKAVVTGSDEDCGEPIEEPCEAGPGYATLIHSSEQGTTKNGGSINSDRTNPESATGEPDGEFYSLGVEGRITVEFDGYVTDEDGVDLSFHEVTNGRANYPEETVKVEVSQNGDDWYDIGTVGNHDGGDGVGYLDFGFTGLEWVKFVRISEMSDFGPHKSNADGYDLDAVDATNIDCDEPENEPEAVLVAHKIVCEEESMLPNWGARGGPNITEEFAEEWVEENRGCKLEEDWSFEYRVRNGGPNPGNDTYGPAGADWTTFTADGLTAMTLVPIDGTKTLQAREVLPEGYITFSGDKKNDVSAEFYCHSDVANYDNWEWIKNPKDMAVYYCVGFNAEVEEPDPAVIVATKILCEAESYLPNWGDGSSGPGSIDADTADFWLAEGDNAEHCEKVEWDFQWKASPTSNPGDNSGEDEDWDTFSSEDGVELNPEQFEESERIWIREIWSDQFVPFSGVGTQDSESAELYCGNDILNYDNYDYLNNVESGETYYCVAWNAEITGSIAGTVYLDANGNSNQEEEEEAMEGVDVWLLTQNSPFTLHAMTSTDENGDFLFGNLEVPGTYYVCQNVPDGLFQTQYNSAGDGGVDASSFAVGDVIGDSPELDALVAEFCYVVELNQEQLNVVARDFGNYEPEIVTNDEGNVLGDSTTNGEDTGEVLGVTGQATTWMMLLGLFNIAAIFVLRFSNRIVKQSN